ncbi:MAG: hypothetical protein ACYDCN_11585 [Bacteroidia bacterium]
MTNTTEKTLDNTIEYLTLSEAAALVGTSKRTIERHATFLKYKRVSHIKNERKVLCYDKAWILEVFKNDVSDVTSEKHGKTNKNKYDTTKKANTTKINVEFLSFLKNQIQEKDTQLSRLQASNHALIESERQTKTLLADLQFKQKELLLNTPTANKLGKKHAWIWFVAFILVLGAIGTGCYFGYEYILELLK